MTVAMRITELKPYKVSQSAFSAIVKLLEGFSVMRIATVRSQTRSNRDYSPRLVTIGASTAGTVSRTKRRFRMCPFCNT